jgi:hypothetical protein
MTRANNESNPSPEDLRPNGFPKCWKLGKCRKKAPSITARTSSFACIASMCRRKILIFLVSEFADCH